MKVKICGFTNTEDVKLACDFGVDMVGVIMVPGSKRYLDTERAKQVLDAASGRASKVAVVSHRGLDDLLRLENQLKPDYIQMHLTLPLAEFSKARDRLDASLILVAPVPSEVVDRKAVVENAVRAAEIGDILLIDTKGPSGGGTGLPHDWTISREIRASVDKPVFLAGGLNPSNVAEAIKAVGPDGVDVSSGVESSSSVKAPELMREFIKAARGK
ncbi:MAG: phosphoribosylanthranilate isomerase [Methanobacteriota archaeon]